MTDDEFADGIDWSQHEEEVIHDPSENNQLENLSRSTKRRRSKEVPPPVVEKITITFTEDPTKGNNHAS